MGWQDSYAHTGVTPLLEVRMRLDSRQIIDDESVGDYRQVARITNEWANEVEALRNKLYALRTAVEMPRWVNNADTGRVLQCRACDTKWIEPEEHPNDACVLAK